MKVTVSVGGTFHAFRLAEQLDRRGMLHRLVTTHHPLRGERITPGRISANPLPEILMRGPRMAGLSWRVGDYLKAVAFDRWAARHVRGCDILVGFASFCLQSLRAARSSGARIVVERGSTHILVQQALVADQCRRWGCAAPPSDPRLVERQLAEYEDADYICVPSGFAMRSFLERGFSPHRLLHVPYGVDLTMFSPGPSRGRPFRVVAVGLSLRKGTPDLLDAVARMGARDVEVCLVGTVPPDLAPILRRSPVPFRHLGALSHPDLAAAYRSASVFVLASVEEGLALSLFEAMACGLPAVVTPNTGAEDIVTGGREALIVPPGDPASLSRALLQLYEDEERRRAMGEAAIRAVRNWTWDAYGDRVVKTYSQILSSAQPAVVSG